jgi:hypothetical protein
MNDVRGVRYPDVRVSLVGEDGNAFAILGRVQKELRRASVEPEEIQEFVREATAGDYDHLLQTAMAWVDVGAEGRTAEDDYEAVETAWEAFKEAHGRCPTDADEFEEWRS